jgi:hypothetical protein
MGWRLAVIYIRHEVRQIPPLTVAGVVAAGFLGGCSPATAGQLPPGPNGYPPAAKQSLNLQGAVSAEVTIAYPSSCGADIGPDGEEGFSFAAFFQSQGVWYVIKFETDYFSRQYKGPGTYTVQADIYPMTHDGPTDPSYSGSVRLTVSESAQPWVGGVSGTLDWTGSATQNAQVNISGGWTCTSGPMTGPG